MEKDVTSFDDIQCMCNLDLRLDSFVDNQCYVEPKTHLFVNLDFESFTRHKLSLLRSQTSSWAKFLKTSCARKGWFLDSHGIGCPCMSPVL